MSASMVMAQAPSVVMASPIGTMPTSQVTYASSPTMTMPAASPVVAYASPTVGAAAPVATMSGATYTQAVPQYVYPAGSADVPVYGSSVSVPRVYQSSQSMPTITYSQQAPMSNDQMKTIFPMGAPSTFQPFTASQYSYNIVESPSVFVQGAPGTAPAAAVTTMMPTMASVAEPAAPVATFTGGVAAAPGTASIAGVTVPEVAPAAAPSAVEPPAKKKSSSKKSKGSSKKLSSKKKQKGCC